ncbi:hypothetical protein Tco_0870039 [Tanacetum coccineum]
MATMAESVIAAGSKTRPPMLEKGMYDSWKTQIILYIRGKENGEMLKYSIDNGPYQFKPKITVKYTDAVNILLLEFLVDIYTLINHYQTAKEIWDRVKELMECTEITKLERESMLYDEFDKFTSEPGESIHSYYLRYVKLINDMKMIPMSMSNMQINTNCSTTTNISTDTGFVAPTFLPINDPIASLNKAMIFLSFAYNSRYPPTNNQLQTSSNPRTQATIQNGRVTIQNVQGRQSQGYAGNARKNQASGARVVNRVGNAGQINQDSEWFKDKMLIAQAQEAGVVLNDEQQEFLADSLEEADDYCDDKAKTNAIFMANLSPVGSINADTVEPHYDSDILSEIGSWEQSNIRGAFKQDVIQFSENLKETFKLLKKGFIAEVKERKDIFEQMEDEVDQCSVAKKCFKIEKKQLLINNDRLLEENIASDIMCTCSLNEVDNCGKCKSLDNVLLDLQESNKSLCEVRKRFAKLKEYIIALDLAFQNHKEQMTHNDPETKNK